MFPRGKSPVTELNPAMTHTSSPIVIDTILDYDNLPLFEVSTIVLMECISNLVFLFNLRKQLKNQFPIWLILIPFGAALVTLPSHS